MKTMKIIGLVTAAAAALITAGAVFSARRKCV